MPKYDSYIIPSIDAIVVVEVENDDIIFRVLSDLTDLDNRYTIAVV
jgi:hypothetical protein